jgi:farnesyl-diphosphate farnesyltransferase
MDAILNSILYPSEVKALLQYKFLYTDKTQFKSLQSVPEKGHEKHSWAMCYYFLNLTSRSFARVIQELDVELRHAVCIFYIVLRGLDTIEDDMTIPVEEKVRLLRAFYEYNQKAGWSYNGNSPLEKDAVLLKNYSVVIEELSKLKPEYRKTILEITKKMGEGMALFANGKKVVTLDDYNLYTHYVAGLVGDGLTSLFVQSGLEKPTLGLQERLSNDMGLFLQKTNILKDYLADIEQGRLFWPENIWRQYVAESEGVEALAKPQNLPNALGCLNHLCANALVLVPSCLEYLSKLENKTVFRFAAIPQLMAIASISLFYNNPEIFSKKGNKIRKGLAVKLILSAEDFESVKQIYYDYAIHISQTSRAVLGRNDKDKSFNSISVATSNVFLFHVDRSLDTGS